MSYSTGIKTGVTTKWGHRAMHKNAFDPIFGSLGANTNLPSKANDESIEQRARRVYGTKEQQALKARSITGSDILVEPFTSCLVASEVNV